MKTKQDNHTNLPYLRLWLLMADDGRVVSEKHLGKFAGDPSETKTREATLSKWLVEMGL